MSETVTRQFRYSSRDIHSRTPKRRVSQPAMPTWSGCMCVTNTRVSLRSNGGAESSLLQISSVSSVRGPVSTSA